MSDEYLIWRLPKWQPTVEEVSELFVRQKQHFELWKVYHEARQHDWKSRNTSALEARQTEWYGRNASSYALEGEQVPWRSRNASSSALEARQAEWRGNWTSTNWWDSTSWRTSSSSWWDSTSSLTSSSSWRNSSSSWWQGRDETGEPEEQQQQQQASSQPQCCSMPLEFDPTFIPPIFRRSNTTPSEI